MKPILVIATFSSGSTYFQRAATFWIHELINNQIVNPHEILNGLALTQDSIVKQWMKVTDQSLDTITSILLSVKRPMLVRLSYDHLLLRNETSIDLERFYHFLNEKFNVFICCRDDLFDYGMCWAVRRCTDRPYDKQINNVHSAQDRAILYNDKLKFVVDPNLVIEQAEKYLRYRQWALETFPSATVINYEDLDKNIDAVLHSHFPATTSIKEKWGVSISEYTKQCYELSKELDTHLPSKLRAMLTYLESMCKNNIMLDSIPIKSTTIDDKRALVYNYEDAYEMFASWKSLNLHHWSIK